VVLLKCEKCFAQVEFDIKIFERNCEACGVPLAQVVFALWTDGLYYPAVIAERLLHRANVVFFDGHSATVADEDIMDVEEALKTLNLQGKWKNRRIYYKGSLASFDPMVMHYNDGDVEEIAFRQLRGKKGGKPNKPPTSSNVSSTLDLASSVITWISD